MVFFNAVHKNRTGSLLVVTLALITVLATLTIATARYLSLQLRLTKYYEAREQAKAFARSGVYLAMDRLMEDAAEGYDWLEDPDWAFFEEDPEDPTTWFVPVDLEHFDLSAPRSGEYIEVHMMDEERKPNLNEAANEDILFEVLLGIFENKVEESARSAAIITDYIDGNDIPHPSPNIGLEEDSGTTPFYKAKDASVIAFDELLEIPELADQANDLFEVLRKYTSIHYVDGEKALNINTVDAEVAVEVLDVLGATPEFILTGVSDLSGENLASQIEDCKKQKEVFKNIGEVDCGDLAMIIIHASAGPKFKEYFRVDSQVFTVQSKVELQDPKVVMAIEAVVDRSGTTVPIDIVSWSEH